MGITIAVGVVILWVIWFHLMSGINFPDFATSSSPIVKIQEIQEKAIEGVAEGEKDFSNFSWENLLGQESTTQEETEGLPDLEAPSF